MTITEFASFIGTLTSSFPGNQFGPLYYRAMLKLKDKSLKYNKGNFNAVIKLSEDTFYEIACWKKNIFKAFKPIRYPKISIIIYTDTSLEGWGTSMGNVYTGGACFPDEKLMHINVLELKAILLALKPFVKTSHKHIKIMSGNTTAIHCSNKMETSHSMECHHEVLKIWEWAIIYKNHLSAAHIPGKLNTVAEKESRSNHIDTEWMLQSKFLNLALEHLCFKPEIDLFATSINTQFGKYAAFRPDPGAMYIDVFSIDSFDLNFYAFPPISVIPGVLAKVKQDSAEGIIIVPFWPTQVWYPIMLEMLVSTPILLNSTKSLLVLPQTRNLVHPIWKKMNMLVVHFSGSLQKANQRCRDALCRDALEILSASWRMGIEKRYNSHVERFAKFCCERYTDPIQATTEMGIEFLTDYFKTGVGYSSVNSARSALSRIIKPVCNVPFGKSPLVCRFVKGIFNIWPALPRYVTTWDVIKVFTFIQSKPTLTNCDLKPLSHRLAILLC